VDKVLQKKDGICGPDRLRLGDIDRPIKVKMKRKLVPFFVDFEGLPTRGEFFLPSAA
jgi:hypothetical protein